jgi:Tfp pilus assembly protein PilF
MMRLAKAISVLLHRTGRNTLMPAMVLAFMLPACATQSLKIPAPPPLLNAGPAVVVPDVDLLAINPHMEEFLHRYVLEYDDPGLKRQLLSLALSSKAMLGFHYNPERTLTAEEAFNTRSGNCIAFANLFIAMAREAGLKARYHEVQIPPEWDSQDDTFIVSKHINVVVDGPHGNWEVDISGQEIKVNAKRRIMRDSEATAMYFNNLAMEALFNSDLPTAYAYLGKAIETAPGFSDPWSNLGVVLYRNGQIRDAELAYRTALMINPAELSAMGNLYDLYMDEENLTAADDLEKRVERYRQENPYYLMLLSDEALEQREYNESIKLLNRAIAKKEDEHRLHFALARTQYLSGHPDAAESSLNRARELAPEGVRQGYDRPLRELIQSEPSNALN